MENDHDSGSATELIRATEKLAVDQTKSPVPAHSMAIRFRSVRGSWDWLALRDRARTTIGRALACDVVFASPHVSRLHATIDLVDDQHILQDCKSANGTHLNGLPVTNHAFSLRAGDVIEIGSECLIYTGALASGATAPESATGSGTCFPISDLVRDGYARLDSPDRASLLSELQGAFMGVPEKEGIEANLEVIRQRLEVQKVALFLEGTDRRLAPFAARPGLEAAISVADIASQVWSTEQGRLLRWVAPMPLESRVSTRLQETQSHAAVPIQRWPACTGALAVERTQGKRLDRSDLALLAVLGDRLSLMLSLLGAEDIDTIRGRSS